MADPNPCNPIPLEPITPPDFGTQSDDGGGSGQPAPPKPPRPPQDPK